MYYDCWCEEAGGCTGAGPGRGVRHNSTRLWWGEFAPCRYTAYIFTPLACPDFVA